MKIFFYSCKAFESPYLNAANEKHFETGATTESLSLETVNKSKGYDVVSIFTGDDASAPVLTELKRNGIAYIAIRAAGYDNVDMLKAKELGIKVANVPAYSPYAVAEHTVAMMLALNRNLILANRQVHKQNFTLDNLIGFDLNKKTVGIIGTGRIGSVVAKILHGFGCKLLAYDLVPNKELEFEYNVEYTNLDHLYSSADIITLHTPFTKSTYHLINAIQLSKMKEGVMLINTSRGALINTTELLPFLEKGHIGYFGMDVYEKERGLFFYDHSGENLDDELFKELVAMPNVLITPHQAFATVEALCNIASATYYNIDCWSRGLNSANELHIEIPAAEIYQEKEF